MKKKDVDLLMHLMARLIWLNYWVSKGDKEMIDRSIKEVDEVYKKLVK